MAFLLKRTLILIVTLILVSLAIFSVLMVIPGDPAQIILGVHATPETLSLATPDGIGSARDHPVSELP